MKKILLMGLGTFFFTWLCFAQDYYATVEHRVKHKDGTTFAAYTITKVPNEDACKKVSDQKSQLKDKLVVRTLCATGQEWDKTFEDIFANKPVSMLYVSYTDRSGYETRTYMKVLAALNSPAPGLPVDLTPEAALVWANDAIKTLAASGIKNAKIIYSKESKITNPQK
jgi:hypothetical protein